jgi:glucose-1-phosphate cytidylyltransferase
MKVVILAGGRGSRLNGFSDGIPKPLVKIGGTPILMHLMQIYADQGVKDFVILTGYRGHLIREYFYNLWPTLNDFTINLKTGIVESSSKSNELDWNVTLIDTGQETMTGGRLLRVKSLLEDESNFFFTYGDGLANINLKELFEHHLLSGLTATITAINPPSRFGALSINDGLVEDFTEKPKKEGPYVNGGFFCLSNKIFKYISDDSTIFENEPLKKLVSDKQLSAYSHLGFWQCMDSPRDVEILNQLNKISPPPWSVINDFK